MYRHCHVAASVAAGTIGTSASRMWIMVVYMVKWWFAVCLVLRQSHHKVDSMESLQALHVCDTLKNNFIGLCTVCTVFIGSFVIRGAMLTCVFDRIVTLLQSLCCCLYVDIVKNAYYECILRYLHHRLTLLTLTLILTLFILTLTRHLKLWIVSMRAVFFSLTKTKTKTSSTKIN